MTSTHTRTRRAFPTPLPSNDLRASKQEVSRDLQQFYQGSVLQSAAEESAMNVSFIQRRRTYSGKEAELLDAVLGLASFVCESERSVGTAKVKKRSDGKIKAKSVLSATPKAKIVPKPRPTPPLASKNKKSTQSPLRKIVSQPFFQPSYQFPYGYSFPTMNYFCPYYDKPSAIMPLAPGQGYPPFGLMLEQGMYGWPVTVAQPAPVLEMSTARVYKRSARHVAIAFLIKNEEGKRKASQVGSNGRLQT